MSKEIEFKSALKPFIEDFLNVKKSMGQYVYKIQYTLKDIDNFYISRNVTLPVITKEIVENWKKTRINDKIRTLNDKLSIWIQLARYMTLHGQDCYIPEGSLSRKKNNEIFVPYIFTHNQIKNLFEKSNELRLRCHYSQVSLFSIPAILRLIYSTGLRISEALSIQNQDVDFEEKCILIKDTKNKMDRLVPINKSLLNVLLHYKSYRDKMPYTNIRDKDHFFFVRTDGSPCTTKGVTHWFRYLLEQCNIPYIGNFHGPRIHDLRHTFAVHTLAQMCKQGIDLYTSLPIISAILGHKTLSGTEKYVRLTKEMYPDITDKMSEFNSFIYPKNVYHDEKSY